MGHIVLKPFGWYPDGFTREALVIGDERDFGTSADGLKAAGMIGVKPEPQPGGYFMDESASDVDMTGSSAGDTEQKPRKRRK